MMISSSLYSGIEGPFDVDESTLLDKAITKVTGDPEIKAAVEELQNPIDIALKVKKQRKNILHNIAGPLDRTRLCGERLHELLVASDESLKRLVAVAAGLRSMKRAVQEALADQAPDSADDIIPGPSDNALLARARDQRLRAESILASGVGESIKAAWRVVVPQSSESQRAAEEPAVDLRTELAKLNETLEQLDELKSRALLDRLPEERRQLEFRALEGQWQAAFSELTQTVELTVHSICLTEVNSELERHYDPRMRVRSADGLRKKLTRDKTVRTPAFDQLEVMMRHRQGGSFGISGPRGVGKSTLIDFFTKLDEATDEGEPSSRAKLGTRVSAPVQYDRQEFVLYLHTRVCHEIIGGRDAERAVDDLSTPEAGYLTRTVMKLAVIVSGSVLAVAGVALLADALTVRPGPKDPAVWTGMALTAAAVAALVLFLNSILMLVNYVLPAHRTSSRVDSGELCTLEESFAAQQVSAEYLHFRYRNHLRGLRLAGLSCLLFVLSAGSGASLLVAATPWWTGTWSFVLGETAVAVSLSLWFVSNWLPRASSSEVGRTVFRLDRLSRTRYTPELVEAARQQLRRIRYQQAFSSERSMGAKVGGTRQFPMSLESAMKRGTTWSERQQTYPEIVNDFVDFLVTVASKHDVVIAIDELDKIKDVESAQDFLNDIKGIFDAPGCCFIVSVSEDAAANFERRGAPFRDVFDSAFDDMVIVDRLTLADARKILYGLLLGWTEPFIGLCYVLSGGLPRDLHRSARAVVGDVFNGGEKHEIELGDAMLDVFRRDACGRLRAIRKSLTSDSLDAAGLDLLELLNHIEPMEGTTGELFKRWYEQLRQWTQEHGHSSDMAQQPRAVRLGKELEAFMYCSMTAFEFFDSDRISARMREARGAAFGKKSLDTLAAARHAISLDPVASLSHTKGFREAWELA